MKWFFFILIVITFKAFETVFFLYKSISFKKTPLNLNYRNCCNKNERRIQIYKNFINPWNVTLTVHQKKT